MVEVLAVTGPSGSGKTTTCARAGVKPLALDGFYCPASVSDLPKWRGEIDWENIRSYNLDTAVTTVHQVLQTGSAKVPIYDLAKDSVTGYSRFTRLPGSPLVMEGLFASQVCRAIDSSFSWELFVIQRSRLANLIDRVGRDLAERRLPLPHIVRRSVRLFHLERELVDAMAGVEGRRVTRRELENHLRNEATRVRSAFLT